MCLLEKKEVITLLFSFYPAVLEKEMATHSSILAWRIPWMEELGGLQSTGLKESTQLSDFTSLSLTVFSVDTRQFIAPHFG